MKIDLKRHQHGGVLTVLTVLVASLLLTVISGDEPDGPQRVYSPNRPYTDDEEKAKISYDPEEEGKPAPPTAVATDVVAGEDEDNDNYRLNLIPTGEAADLEKKWPNTWTSLGLLEGSVCIVAQVGKYLTLWAAGLTVSTYMDAIAMGLNYTVDLPRKQLNFSMNQRFFDGAVDQIACHKTVSDTTDYAKEQQDRANRLSRAERRQEEEQKKRDKERAMQEAAQKQKEAEEAAATEMTTTPALVEAVPQAGNPIHGVVPVAGDGVPGVSGRR